MFSATVRDHSRLKCWKIIETFCLFCRNSDLDILLMSSPDTTISPALDSSSPFNNLIKVDLPAPE